VRTPIARRSSERYVLCDPNIVTVGLDFEPGPACPKCRSPRTDKMTVHSANDREFDFFACRTCTHMWIITKSPPAEEV
jgi:hypothetical protein